MATLRMKTTGWRETAAFLIVITGVIYLFQYAERVDSRPPEIAVRVHAGPAKTNDDGVVMFEHATEDWKSACASEDWSAISYQRGVSLTRVGLLRSGALNINEAEHFCRNFKKGSWWGR